MPTKFRGGPIRPQFMLYDLRVESGLMNSPQVPCVRMHETEGGFSFHSHSHTHTLTPDQARQLAGDLIAAAETAEGRA